MLLPVLSRPEGNLSQDNSHGTELNCDEHSCWPGGIVGPRAEKEEAKERGFLLGTFRILVQGCLEQDPVTEQLVGTDQMTLYIKLLNKKEEM
ncbi:hypothetical protein lerEdw1_017300 [Lerista edwardsae]|nr:hypothetical protein lerEdw1_017300 [Lerista edwardsae]